MAPTLEEWWRDMPKVTKAMMVSVVATTVALMLNIVTIDMLYLDMNLVVKKFQVWRIVTCFTFFGPISLGWAIQLYILYISHKQTTSTEEHFMHQLFPFSSCFDCWHGIVTTVVIVTLSYRDCIDRGCCCCCCGQEQIWFDSGGPTFLWRDCNG